MAGYCTSVWAYFHEPQASVCMYHAYSFNVLCCTCIITVSCMKHIPTHVSCVHGNSLVRKFFVYLMS